MLIQFVLIFVFLLLLMRILQQRTLGLVFKAMSVILTLIASYIVTFPDVTNRIAKFAGVGRGADLIIYICMAVVVYLLTICYTRLRNTELRIARLIQHGAIERARLEGFTAQVNAKHNN